MTTHEVVVQYEKLRLYCDRSWKRIKEKYKKQIVCANGCSDCCELRSANFLEAYLIAVHLGSSNLYGKTGPPAETGCPFLENGSCRIYAVRPLICRTHGLPLKSREFSDRAALSCPRNFADTDLSAFGDADAVDIDRITENLARLNAAFCMLLGDLKKTGQRILMADLADGSVKSGWFGVTGG